MVWRESTQGPVMDWMWVGWRVGSVEMRTGFLEWVTEWLEVPLTETAAAEGRGKKKRSVPVLRDKALLHSQSFLPDEGSSSPRWGSRPLSGPHHAARREEV